MRKSYWIVTGVILCLVAGGVTWGLTRTNQRVELVAAASLADVLEDQVARMNSASTPSIRISTAGSQTVARQIVHGKPADLVLLAHPRWMRYLENKGMLRPGSRRTLLSNRLVLIGTAGSSLPIHRIGDLRTYGGRVAIGNPQAVPAGIYARMALENLHLWSSVSDQVVSFPHVRAALSAVSSGNIRVGIVYRTDARKVPGVRNLVPIPSRATPAIRYEVALIRGADGPAQRVFQLLTNEKALETYRDNGFLVVSSDD